MVVEHHEDIQHEEIQASEITALTLATDALEYSRKLVEIFSRAADGQYGRLEDSSLHRNRCAWDAAPENWMATPMVPLYISSIFGSALDASSALQRPLVKKIGLYICADFEKIVEMGRSITSRRNSGLSIAVSNASHLLPHIRNSLE